MKKNIIFSVLVYIIVVIFTNQAFAANNDACKTFRVVFENKISNIPKYVFANGVKIGNTERSETVSGSSLVVFVCIDNKDSGKFEKNSACYVSGDKMIVYNVWSTGVDLKEGESIRGFTDRIDLYVYEAKELFVFIRDVAIAFVLDLAGKFFGESSVSKAKDMLWTIGK